MFATDYSDKMSALEKAIAGVAYSKQINLIEDVSRKRSFGYSMGAYVLPVASVDHRMNGLFAVDGKIMNSPFGFMMPKNFAGAKYMGLDELGELHIHMLGEADTIYLPIVTCSVNMLLHNQENQVVMQKTLYGIKGAKGTLPLLMVSYSKNSPLQMKCLSLIPERRSIKALRLHLIEAGVNDIMTAIAERDKAMLEKDKEAKAAKEKTKVKCEKSAAKAEEKKRLQLSR